MRRLETQSLLQFAAAAVPVLRTLSELDQRMTYKQFGIAIGLVDERWEPWHPASPVPVPNARSQSARNRAEVSAHRLCVPTRTQI